MSLGVFAASMPIENASMSVWKLPKLVRTLVVTGATRILLKRLFATKLQSGKLRRCVPRVKTRRDVRGREEISLEIALLDAHSMCNLIHNVLSVEVKLDSLPVRA